MSHHENTIVCRHYELPHDVDDEPVTDEKIEEIMAENRRRNALLMRPYDPLTGVGCCDVSPRVKVKVGGRALYLPQTLVDDPRFRVAKTNDLSFRRLRCRHDFEYWAAECVTIKEKDSERDIKFILNAPQRRVLRALEADRLADRPIRLIMLKARQWGGSTLVQMYMAWIQTCLRTNWHSLICAHVKDTAATIRGMYTKMLADYPADLWEGETAEARKPTGSSATSCFRPFERSTNVRLIEGRGCKVTLGSSEKVDAIRGADFAMAHLSEVAFWRDTRLTSPEQFIRAICGSINYTPLTLIAWESTANGVGNFFHREWLRSEAGQSDKLPIFVPWHEIEIYRRPVDDAARLVRSFDDYEWRLWSETGCTLEMINWYHCKRREYSSHLLMQAEYPTTAAEAFTTCERNVFPSVEVERLRVDCRDPEAVGEVAGNAPVGAAAIADVRFVPSTAGRTKIWSFPADGDTKGRYVAAVDIGGRAASSDWSVIAVLDCADADHPEVVAQWRGHIDHDLLAWKAAALARFYGDALLIFESNTLESENVEGDPSMYILNQVQRHYRNLYRRADDHGRIGFHTNRSTKTQAISHLIMKVRERGYTERDSDAINELLTYQASLNGSYAAMDGCHDDILMTRAIALLVAAMRRPQPNISAYGRTFPRAW